MPQRREKSQEFAGKLARPPWCYKLWMLAGNRALFFDRLVKDYGDFIHYRGIFNFYLINHPALVKAVLQETHEAFDKNSVIYNRFRHAFGDGLVVSEGKKWKRQRSLMQPMFGPVTVKRYFDLMVDAAQAMIERWAPLCRSGTVFDIADDMNRITLEIAGRALFHDGFTGASDDISRWTHAINRYSGKPPLPIVRDSWFPSRLNFELKRTLREFNDLLQEMIDKRRAAPGGGDLLTILLSARHEEEGDAMTDAEIKEEVLGMIIGGHETSSSALTWMWYELHKNPGVRKRLDEEIDAAVGSGPLTIDHIPQLIYARMIIDETLRLHPPFWFENRNVVKEVELGGERLVPGSLVAFSRWSLHRHGDFWEDPETFNPERFRPDQEENSRSSYACVPFGGGPRICIGVHFALLELVVVLAVVAQRYRVIVDENDRHEMAANLTMTPRYGVQVHLEER